MDLLQEFLLSLGPGIRIEVPLPSLEEEYDNLIPVYSIEMNGIVLPTPLAL